MNYKENIKNVLDFIDQNIKTDISVKHLSQTSSFFIPHLYRLFQQYCSGSPVEYIKKRRLYLAVDELISGKRRIIDIALDYNFDSHDRIHVDEWGNMMKSEFMESIVSLLERY